MTKEERKEYNKRYYAAHRSYYSDYHVGYYAEHGDEIRRRRKDRYASNSNEEREKRKAYYTENKEKTSASRGEYVATKHGRAVNYACSYRKADKDKGFNVSETIDAKWIEDNIYAGQVCHYCGESDWLKLGVDRIDNSKGHTPDNCICSCWDCNRERKNKWTVEEFAEIKRKEKGNV